MNTTWERLQRAREELAGFQQRFQLLSTMENDPTKADEKARLQAYIMAYPGYIRQLEQELAEGSYGGGARTRKHRKSKHRKIKARKAKSRRHRKAH